MALFPSQIELKRKLTPKKHKKKAKNMPMYPNKEQTPAIARANARAPK